MNNLTTQLQLVSLHNALNGVDILHGNDVITVGDVLSNNNVDMGDVVGTELFSGGSLLVFCCKTCN